MKSDPIQSLANHWSLLAPGHDQELTRPAPDISTQLPHVPFQHFVLRLQSSATAEDVYDAYLRLLPLAKQSLAAVNSASEDYNVAMTSEWIALVPRRKAGADGPWGGNAAGMLGLISVPDAAMRDEWERLGWSRWLTELGVAFTE